MYIKCIRKLPWKWSEILILYKHKMAALLSGILLLHICERVGMCPPLFTLCQQSRTLCVYWCIIVCWIQHQSFLFNSESPIYGEGKSKRLSPQQMIRAVLITQNYNTERLQHILLHLNNKQVFTAKSKQHILPLALKAQSWWVSKSASYYEFCSLIILINIAHLLVFNNYYLPNVPVFSIPMSVSMSCILVFQANKMNSPQTFRHKAAMLNCLIPLFCSL